MENKMSLGNWLSLLGLTFATFIFNTSEFIPIGLLTDIKNDFGLTEATVGMLISVYAWAVMILSLPLMLLVSKMEMKRLMLWLLGLFTFFQFMSFASTSYAMLMCSRIGVACAHAVFWSVISPIAVRIVPDKYRSIALSMVVTGSSVAMILGMPLGRIIGLHVGWRMTFMSIGIFSAFTLVYMAWRLPKVPSRGGFSPKKLPALLKQQGIIGLYIFTLLISSSYYVAYSYIEPFLLQMAGMAESVVTVMLTVFGVAGIVGSFLFARFFDGHRRMFFRTAVASLVVALFALGLAACNPALIVVDFLVWGVASTAFNVAFQGEVIRITSQDEAAVATSIYSGIFNLGIGGGSALGGVVVSSLGVGVIGYAGGALVLVAFAFLCTWLLDKVAPKR